MKSHLKIALMLAAVAALAAPAYADNGNCGNGQGTGNACLGGSNGSGNGGAGGNGGNGGNGGSGGNAQASVTARVSAGAHATANAVSANRNSNKNQNTNTAQGGTATSQAAGGNATGGTATAAGGQGGTASAAGGSGVGSVTTNVERPPVATAYASPLAVSNGSCAGSKSGGAQGVGFGLSIGTTTEDAKCDARYDALHWAHLGMNDVAVARLCQIPENAAAMKAAGKTCPQVGVAAVASSTPTEPTDPYVRRRLGLAPLTP